MSQLPRTRQLRIDQLIAAWCIALTLLMEGSVVRVRTEAMALLPSLPIADLPVLSQPREAIATPSGITAPQYLVVDLNSASILLESPTLEPKPPASVLKLLTAITALDFYQPTDRITLTAADLTPAFDTRNDLELQVGEVVSIQELLASLLIKSDNQTAEIIAAHVPGGRAAFVAAMQAKAQQLGFGQHLKVSNPSGLDSPDQVATAQELVWLGEQAAAHPILAALMAQKNHLMAGQIGTQTVTHELTNTNQLLWSELPVVAGKTGTTEAAGEVLLSIFQIQNRPVMIIVMGSADRYADTRAIYNWIETHYRWHRWSSFVAGSALQVSQ